MSTTSRAREVACILSSIIESMAEARPRLERRHVPVGSLTSADMSALQHRFAIEPTTELNILEWKDGCLFEVAERTPGGCHMYPTLDMRGHAHIPRVP